MPRSILAALSNKHGLSVCLSVCISVAAYIVLPTLFRVLMSGIRTLQLNGTENARIINETAKKSPKLYDGKDSCRVFMVLTKTRSGPQKTLPSRRRKI